MRIAYLILAHNQPLLLWKLITALQGKDTHFFIHIDNKTEIRPFKAAIQRLRNITLVPRHAVNWFGFSMVEATLTLMHHASSDQEFDYYSLLSGADYPIKSNDYISNLLASSKTEWISYWRFDETADWHHKIEHYYLTDIFPLRGRDSHLVISLYWKAFFGLRNHLLKRTYFADLLPFGGSQWWSLTHQCVRFILRYVNEHPAYVRFHRYTHGPDEIFFHTIVMNSSFADRVPHFELAQQHWAATGKREVHWRPPEASFNLRYIDWSGLISKQRETPAILDERDFDQLKNTTAIVARKFEQKRSFQILERIDRELR